MKISDSFLREIIRLSEELNLIHDLDAVLDKVLSEARRFTVSDAGSIFLKEGKALKFRYVQNDTLFKGNDKNKFIYSNSEVPINHSSITGFVASTGKELIIDDAYSLSDNLPYSFNRSFDKSSNYRTQSILAVPLKLGGGRVVGVLQLINAKNESGEITKYTEGDVRIVSYFSNIAAAAVERAVMTREGVLRMLKIAELRDPKETGAHVNRVGAYSAEIYQRWAEKKGFSDSKVRKMKDIIRIAAMTHDLGKVAISDLILKKPAKLNDEEFEIMKHHTVYGAGLFDESGSELDRVSSRIALNHHEKWNGAGYPGEYKPDGSDSVHFGRGKSGEEIPVEARITALADVYDALVSKRVYKAAWEEEKVVSHIKEEAGSHFDPEIVEAFLEIYEVVQAIREKFSD